MSTPSHRLTRLAALLLASGLIAFLVSGVSGGISPAHAQEAAPAKSFSNYSGTGPGPTGPTELRSATENERLYISLKGFLMSPYCPGLTLGACGSGAAEVLRADLREWVDAGHSRDDIIRYYVGTFGEEFLGRPPFRGSAIAVWVAPIAAVLLGLLGIVLWLRRAAPSNAGESADSRSATQDATAAIDPETDARIEAEIKARYS